MSGIVGVLGIDGETPASSFLQALTRSMAFRGPDVQQIWVGKGIGLGHALLSIGSSSSVEQQPFSLNGELWIVADARLDGRAELLSKLHAAGDSCQRNAGDAELILRAYAAWGQACLEHLLGDFCFAIWDGNRGSLFCAHDQIGIKPFYYAVTKSWLVFSNTLDCVRMQPGTGSRLNDLAVADFLLFGSLQEPSATIFAGIHRLPPAHSLTWRDGELFLKRYWTPPEDEEIRYRHGRDYEEHFLQLLQTAVRDRLRSDRVAISLSGGLDSTSVAAAARRTGGSNLCAFTTVFERVIPCKELHYSRLSAEALGIPVEFLAGDDYVSAAQPDLPEVPSPQPDENVLAVFDADFYRLAAGSSRTLLTGQGGDLGLYPSNSHFRRLLTQRRLGRFLQDGIKYASARRGLPPIGLRTLLQRRLGNAEPWRGNYPPWLNPDFESRLQLRERWNRKIVTDAAHRHRPEAVGQLLAPVWQNYLEACDPGITRICLEHVHPFLDLRLLRFLFAIPPVPWTLDKRLLRSAMRNILPQAIRLRPKAPLAGNPWLIFVRRNHHAFSQLPSHLTSYMDMGKYRHFLQSPAPFDENNYQFAVRPTMLDAWISGTFAFKGN